MAQELQQAKSRVAAMIPRCMHLLLPHPPTAVEEPAGGGRVGLSAAPPANSAAVVLPPGDSAGAAAVRAAAAPASMSDPASWAIPEPTEHERLSAETAAMWWQLAYAKWGRP